MNVNFWQIAKMILKNSAYYVKINIYDSRGG